MTGAPAAQPVHSARPEHALRSDQVARLIGCSYRNLDNWVRRGLFVDVENPGSGSARLWYGPDIARARVVAALRTVGLPIEAIRGVLADLDAYGWPDVPLSAVWIASDRPLSAVCIASDRVYLAIPPILKAGQAAVYLQLEDPTS